jgi:hypothetical protein
MYHTFKALKTENKEKKMGQKNVQNKSNKPKDPKYIYIYINKIKKNKKMVSEFS